MSQSRKTGPVETERDTISDALALAGLLASAAAGLARAAMRRRASADGPRVGEYVVVATASRPSIVAHGRLEEISGDEIVLADARCAVYYDRETRGVFGAAVRGPGAASRITEAAEAVRLRGVELILRATPEATAAWEAEPWN